jgi:GDP-mannose 6-dehydrogenase
MRSAMLPGTMREAVIPTLENASRKKAGTGVRAVHQPRVPSRGDVSLRLRPSAQDGEVRADNAWHALKVAFANEVGTLCKALEVDAHRVMDIFCQDRKVNLSPYYFKPGLAFGGSCLRALLYKAKRLDVALPVFASVLPSHQLQIERGRLTVRGCRKSSCRWLAP